MSLLAVGAAAANAISPLTLAREVGTLIRDSRSGSIIEYSRVTRADSLTIVDGRAAQLPYIDSVLNSLLNIVTAYYLQAISVDQISDARVMRTLGKFNPDRDLIEAASGSRYLSMMSLEHAKALPLYDESMSLEDAFTIENVAPGRDALKEVERSGLSVGKLINVEIKHEDKTVTFPFNIRLLTQLIPPKDVLELLMPQSATERSLKERWHLARAGQISWIKDFLLCQDLVDDHRRRMINDSTGLYRQVSARASKNRAAAILSGQPTVAQASALIVLAKDTANELEQEGRLRLNDPRGLARFFDNNLAMILAVCDPDWDTVTLYYRGIPESNTISIKEIEKLSRSKGGPDILDVLNSLREVKAPSF